MRKAEIEKRKEYIKELQNSMVKAKKELITLEATKDDYVPPLDDLIATEKKWVKYLEWNWDTRKIVEGARTMTSRSIKMNVFMPKKAHKTHMMTQ